MRKDYAKIKDPACLKKGIYILEIVECNVKENALWCKGLNDVWVFCEYIDTNVRL